MATKSSRRSLRRLAASAGNSSSPESAPTCSTTPRTTSSGSSRAPHTSRSTAVRIHRRTGSMISARRPVAATSSQVVPPSLTSCPSPTTTPVYTTTIAPVSTSQPITSWATPWKRPGRSRSAFTIAPTTRSGTVASSKSAPASSSSGAWGPCSNCSGTTASHAATAPAATHIGNGSGSPRRRHQQITNRMVAAVAEMPTSHVATSSTWTPGSSVAVPNATTAISPAVIHHAISIARRRSVRASSHGNSAASTPVAIGLAQSNAPCTFDQPLSESASVASFAWIATATISAAMPTTIRQPPRRRWPYRVTERGTDDEVDDTDQEPGDDPPVVAVGVDAVLRDPQAEHDADGDTTDRGCERGRTDARGPAHRSGGRRRVVVRHPHPSIHDGTTVVVPSGWYSSPDFDPSVVRDIVVTAT